MGAFDVRQLGFSRVGFDMVKQEVKNELRRLAILKGLDALVS